VRITSLPLLGTCLLLATTLVASKVTSYRRPEDLAQPLERISRQIAGLQAVDNPPLADDVLLQLKPSSYLSRKYKKGDMVADLLVTYYAVQRAGESMHSPKHCLPGAGWEIWDYGTLEIPAGGQKHKVNRQFISRENVRMIVLYWYQSKSRIIASEYSGKILLAKDALLQNSTAASIVRIIVPDRPGALETASGFAAELIPQVARCFRGTEAAERAGR
jgi:EpsI family protein